MTTSRPGELDVGPGRILRRFTAQETRQLVDAWIDSYARNAREANIRAYLWHAFSSGAYPSVCREEAMRCYAEHTASELLVVSNDRRSAVLTDALPTRCNVPDYLVFPPSLSWTMAFTHEDGWLGPYFAKHADHEALVLNDSRRSRALQGRRQELERARREGWA
jgi:hypothetical protein